MAGPAKAQWVAAITPDPNYIPTASASGGGSGSASIITGLYSINPPVSLGGVSTTATCSGSAPSSGAEYDVQDDVKYTWTGTGTPTPLSLTFTASASASFTGQGDGSGSMSSGASTSASSTVYASARSFPAKNGSPAPVSGSVPLSNASPQTFTVSSGSGGGADAAVSPGGSYNGAASASITFHQ